MFMFDNYCDGASINIKLTANRIFKVGNRIIFNAGILQKVIAKIGSAKKGWYFSLKNRKQCQALIQA